MSKIESIEKLREKSLEYPPNIRREVNIALDNIEREIADYIFDLECYRIQCDEYKRLLKLGERTMKIETALLILFCILMPFIGSFNGIAW